MAQVFAISINGSSLSPSQFVLWAVKAMRQKQRTEDEKVVYLSCPCSERLREIKTVLQQAGFVVIYALETPPEDAIVIYVHCPLTDREREILQAILSTGSVKKCCCQIGSFHQHRSQTFATHACRFQCSLNPSTHRHRPSKRLYPMGRRTFC
jgi:hypothetical protein